MALYEVWIGDLDRRNYRKSRTQSDKNNKVFGHNGDLDRRNYRKSKDSIGRE